VRLMRAIQVFATIVVLCFSTAWARQQSNGTQSNSPGVPIQPLPPETGNSNRSQTIPAAVGGSFPQNDAQPEASAQAQPDTHVLSGVETLGLGSLRGLRRIFDPALRFSEFGETGMVAGRTVAVSSLGGSLDVEQRWGRYHLAAVYNGAETMYQPSYNGIHYLPYHDAGISQQILLGRWTVQLRDDVLYSWASGFGGLFTGGPARVGQNASLNSIQPSLVPSGTIQTGPARQLNNIALGEADYAFSRRTTLTFVGSYGLLHFLDPGYINSRSINGRVGYNYALSAKNNIALTYDYGRMSFDGASGRMQTDLVQMAFGRKVTGRLAFQLAAGPQLLRLDNFGPSRHQSWLSWSAFSALTYDLRRTGYSLSYFHGVTAGSGVFFGSKSETITAMVYHEFTRVWSSSVNGGYAVNKTLVPAGIFASRFDNWFGGASLNRQMGRQVRFSLSYGFQRQSRGGGGCPVLGCGLPGSFSQFGVTLQWHPLSVRSR
jgi:hypothetical protein